MSTADVIRAEQAAPRRHFIFTDEHDQLRESIRRFVAAEVLPHADEWEETTFPDSIIRRMGELGFLGLDKPVEYGGQGGDYYCSLVLAEELVRGHSGGLTMGVAVQTDMALPPILKFGTEEQKQQWAAPRDRRREDPLPGDHRAGRGLGRGGDQDPRRLRRGQPTST